jgi:hypothetical protein
MDIEFIAGFAVIAPDPATSRGLYVDALGLPLEASAGSDCFHSERIGGAGLRGLAARRGADRRHLLRPVVPRGGLSQSFGRFFHERTDRITREWLRRPARRAVVRSSVTTPVNTDTVGA